MKYAALASVLIAFVISCAVPSVVIVYNPPSVSAEYQQVQAAPLTLKELATQIAAQYGIGTTTLFNLIQSESEWNPKADNGYDRGLAQISRIYHPDITDAQAFDPTFALNYAAKIVKEGKQSDVFVSCNCFSFVRTLVPNLPLLERNVVPNSPPKIGSVAIFDYNGTPHYGYVVSLGTYGFSIREANFKPCVLDTRTISYNDNALVGFYEAP